MRRNFNMRGIIKGLVILACVLFLMSGCATSMDKRVLESQRVDVVVTVKNVEGKAIEVSKAGDGINRGMEVANPEGSLSQMSFILNGKAFTKIFSGLSVSDVTRLWNDLTYLENNTDIRTIDLFINSPGGDAFSGLALADQIERAKKKGFVIRAHASGIIASAAVPVFAVCSERYAASGTILMIHEAALWKWPGRETASDIRSQNELMKILRDRYIEKLVANSNLDKEAWEKLELKTTWFSANQAMEWGLIDFIE